MLTSIGVLCLGVTAAVAGLLVVKDAYSGEDFAMGCLFLGSGVAAATLSIISLATGGS